VPRPRAERLEPEPVQQVVDGLQAAGDAELGPEDAADVLAPQGTHPVGTGRAGPQAVPQPLLLFRRQRAIPPAAEEVGQGVRAAGVVPADPDPDRPLGQEHLGGDLRRGAAEEGQPDGGQPAGHPGPGLGPDEVGEAVGGVVRLDVQAVSYRDASILLSHRTAGS
jgi:hypothetical protein